MAAITGVLGSSSKTVPKKQRQACILTGEKSIGDARHEVDLFPSINLESPLQPDKEINSCAQIDDLAGWPLHQRLQVQKDGPIPFHPSSDNVAPSGLSVQEASFQQDAFPILKSCQVIDPSSSVPVQTNQLLQQRHLSYLVPCDGSTESYQPWITPPLATDAPCKPDNVTTAPDATWSVSREEMQQPPQEYPKYWDHVHPRSSQAYHPTSGSIWSNNTHHEGYGSMLKAKDENANIGPLTQQLRLTALPGNAHHHIANEHFKGLSSFIASQSKLSISIRAPSDWNSDPGAATSPKLGTNAQPSVARYFPGGAHFDFDSRTGEQLTHSRAKRRQSTEEKASSQRIRRRGGSCDACRLGHRKCDPLHPKPGSLSRSKLGGWSKAEHRCHGKANAAKGSISRPGVQKLKLVRPGDLGGAASSTCHWAEASYLPEGPTSSDADTSPPGSSQESRSDNSLDHSFPSFADSSGAEGVYASTDTSRLSHSLLETVHSSATPPSSVDHLSVLEHVDDDDPSVENLNSHRDSYVSLEQVEPSTDIFADFDVDFASGDMDILATGEQFTGYDQISLAHERAPFADT